jgi:hypothetical protein
VKLAYKNERDIIDFASQIDDADVCFYPAKSERAHRFLSTLRDGDLSCRESPDFEDVSASLLLEAMIVDDHPRPGKKDKTRAREGAVLRKLKELGLDVRSDATVFAAVSSGLPTHQDHNYRAYVDHFTRTVSDHARKVDSYRQQRPGFDLGFLVFDEATAYLETLGAFGSSGRGSPHCWFADSVFVDVMVRSNVDCFVWLTPYKRLNTLDIGEFPLPLITIIDVKLLAQKESRVYSPQRMISTEV